MDLHERSNAGAEKDLDVVRDVCSYYRSVSDVVVTQVAGLKISMKLNNKVELLCFMT